MFLTDYLLKSLCPHLEFPVCVCTEPHPAQEGNKTLGVFFTAGYSQIGTNLYCQWHQILHRVPSPETPNGSPGPQASCGHGVWKRSICIWQMHLWPPPKPENIYQNDFKFKLTSDDFIHDASIYVIKSLIFRAKKDLGDLLGQHPKPTKEETGGGGPWVEEGHRRTPAVGNRDWARTQRGLLTPCDCIFPLLPVSFQITKTLTRPCRQPTNISQYLLQPNSRKT